MNFIPCSYSLSSTKSPEIIITLSQQLHTLLKLSQIFFNPHLSLGEEEHKETFIMINMQNYLAEYSFWKVKSVLFYSYKFLKIWHTP